MTTKRTPPKRPVSGPLACPSCKVAWYIERVEAGWAFVRADRWWAPTAVHWTARCACRVLFGREEGDLYRQMDVGYA